MKFLENGSRPQPPTSHMAVPITRVCWAMYSQTVYSYRSLLQKSPIREPHIQTVSGGRYILEYVGLCRALHTRRAPYNKMYICIVIRED